MLLHGLSGGAVPRFDFCGGARLVYGADLKTKAASSVKRRGLRYEDNVGVEPHAGGRGWARSELSPS